MSRWPKKLYTFGNDDKFNNWKNEDNSIKQNVYNIQKGFAQGKETMVMYRKLIIIIKVPKWAESGSASGWKSKSMLTKDFHDITFLEAKPGLQTVRAILNENRQNVKEATEGQEKVKKTAFRVITAAMKQYPNIYELLCTNVWAESTGVELSMQDLRIKDADQFSAWKTGIEIGKSIAIDDGAFDSTFGPGIYFSANNEQSKSHGSKYWKCSPNGQQIVNTDFIDESNCAVDSLCPKCVNRNLVSAGMLKRAFAPNAITKVEGYIENPNKRNSFLNQDIANQ
eukprot:3713593-Ditylum_brightwellii.AAC.1